MSDESLAEVESLLSLQSDPHLMWIYDLETLLCIWANDATLAISGYAREDFLRLRHNEIVEVAADDLTWRPATARRPSARLRTRTGDPLFVEINTRDVAVQGRACRIVEACDITAWVHAYREQHIALERERQLRRRAELDCSQFQALFEAGPGLLLVLHPDGYRIVTASDAYLQATMTTREDLVGKPLFDVFPDDPDDTASDGVRNLRASLDRVVGTRRRDVMAVQRYPVRRPRADGGGFEERYWSPINSPVLNSDGRLSFIIHRVEDVTDYVRARTHESKDSAPARAGVDPTLGEVVARAREIQELNRQLEERDRFLAIAGRVARIGGWIVDLETDAVRWSDEVRAIHEIQAGTPISVRDAIGYYAAEWRTVISDHFVACAAHGTPYDLELEIITTTGRRVWVRAIGEPVRAPDGRITHVQGAFQDISSWKTAQADLDRLGRRLTRTLADMGDAFFVLDPGWRFHYLNKRAETLLRYRVQELLGRLIWDAFPEAVGSRFELEYRRAVETGQAVTFEEYYPPLGIWVAVRAYPSDEGLAVYFHDISSQRAAAMALQQQAALLDQARDAILVRSLDHTITYWNKGAERLYGWTADEAVGRTVVALLYNEDDLPFAEAHAALLASDEWHGELTQRTRRGEERIVAARWSLVRDDNGEPQSVLCINTDITAQRKIEANYLRAQRLEGLGTLAGGIAHDLNNTLTPVMMAVSMLQEEAREPETIEWLAAIEESALKAADMVRQILIFARGVEGKRAPVRVERIVDGVAKMVRDTFPKNVSFKQRVSEDLWAVMGDATQCHQVLLNLCVNARDAMPDGGLLQVAAENIEVDAHYAAMVPGATCGPHVRLEVTDTGKGIPAQVLDRVFEPFYTTKNVGQGTGLGLSTVDAIVRSHGGFVTVYSELEKGTTFTVYLPATTAERVDHAAVAELSVERGQGEMILVVDDEAAVRAITKQTLVAYGYRVIAAMDGAEAIARYARQGEEIALVVTDMAMPIMDGPATIQVLRRMNPNVRIVATTGLSRHATLARVHDEGISGILSKPYTALQLLAAVSSALHPSA